MQRRAQFPFLKCRKWECKKHLIIIYWLQRVCFFLPLSHTSLQVFTVPLFSLFHLWKKASFCVFSSLTQNTEDTNSSPNVGPLACRSLRFTKTHSCSSHVRTHWWVWALASLGVSEGQASRSDLTWPAPFFPTKTKPRFGTGVDFGLDPSSASTARHTRVILCSVFFVFLGSYMWH